MKKYTCYIFARGGSKGIKNKNIVKINGKPLIYFTIKEALKSRFIKRIVVSTDSPKIKKISSKYKTDIILRPAKISGDKSPELYAWKHAIQNDLNSEDEIFISLPATSPLRSVKDIDKAILKFKKSNFDILIGITPSQRNPYLNMVKKIGKNIKIVIDRKNYYRRQDVPKVYDITTAIYIAKKRYFLNTKEILKGKVGYIEIPKERSLDIDDMYDLKLAKILLRKEDQWKI